jgi:acetyl esterase
MSPARRDALRTKQAPRFVTDCLNGRRARGIVTEDRTVPGPGGAVPVRVYRPSAPQHGRLPLVVVFHGGGWMFGDLESADWLSSHIAMRTPAIVVSATYRLAPEHPAPAAVEDAFSVLRWAVENGAVLGGSGRYAVLGESSGGTLAASVALMARDRGVAGPDLQVLLYPITDLTLASPSVEELATEPVLSAADLRCYVASYLGEQTHAEDPHLSPLHAPDHHGLPPALIVGASHDPLRDDSRRYAVRLRESGVPVEHHELADAPHGFFSFPRICRAAGPALGLVVASLQRVLAEETTPDRSQRKEEP